jgi:hypothetical protein
VSGPQQRIALDNHSQQQQPIAPALHPRGPWAHAEMHTLLTLLVKSSLRSSRSSLKHTPGAPGTCVPSITEINGVCLVLFGMNNRILEPYLA